MRPPRRDELNRATAEVLRLRGPFQADAYVVDVGQGQVVVKDFAAKPWWARWVGRALVRHETRAYERLGPLPGIPTFVGRIDAHALALERVDGVELTRAPSRYRDGVRHLQQVAEIVERLRARRFYHLDVRGRHNVFLCDDGEVVLFDLGASIWLSRTGVFARLCDRFLTWLYDAAMLKWKVLLAPQTLSEKERTVLGRSRVLRALWIVNIKGSWRDAASAAPAEPPATHQEKTV